MEGNHSKTPDAKGNGSARSVGAILNEKKQSAEPAGAGLTYSFVPFPAELAEMELTGALPPAQIKVLGLRRFANPVTGQWISTTREIARLIRADRSTAQKTLRRLEKAQYLHLQHRRKSTVELIVHFGGFYRPEYREMGLPALVWDADFTTNDTTLAHRRSQNTRSWHSSGQANRGSTQPNLDGYPQPQGTVPRVRDKRDIVRNKEKGKFSTEVIHNPTLLPIETFVPSSHDEAEVQELARKMREKYMNSFLSMRRKYGLNRLKRACALAQDKMLDADSPLLKKPGAYVRWLLITGKC